MTSEELQAAIAELRHCEQMRRDMLAQGGQDVGHWVQMYATRIENLRFEVSHELRKPVREVA